MSEHTPDELEAERTFDLPSLLEATGMARVEPVAKIGCGFTICHNSVKAVE